MGLDVSALAASIVFELSAHGIEAIAHRDINVFMGVVLGWIALHHDLPARNVQIDANVIQPALVMTPARRLNHDATARDAIIELLELRDPLADFRFHGRRRVKMVEGDLKRHLHE